MYRALPFEALAAALWTGVSVLWIVSLAHYGFTFPLALTGVIAGVLFGGATTGFWLRGLAVKGEVRITARYLLFMFVAAAAVLLIIVMIWIYGGFGALVLEANLVYPFVPAFFVTRTSVFFGWELRKKKRVMYDGFWHTRTIAAI